MDEGEYARKGTKTRSWVHTGRPWEPVAWNTERFFIFTGETRISKSNQEDEYVVTKQPGKLVVAQTPFYLADEDNLIQDIHDWAANRPPWMSASLRL